MKSKIVSKYKPKSRVSNNYVWVVHHQYGTMPPVNSIDIFKDESEALKYAYRIVEDYVFENEFGEDALANYMDEIKLESQYEEAIERFNDDPNAREYCISVDLFRTRIK